jgi:hypothetical protein
MRSRALVTSILASAVIVGGIAGYSSCNLAARSNPKSKS